MKYKVSITWKKFGYVEAECRNDAINQVLHNGINPAIHDFKAIRAKHQVKQTSKALRRWKRLAGMRKRGMTIQAIADKEKRSLRTIAQALEKYALVKKPKPRQELLKLK